jgi:hypothetical protein
MRLVSHETSAAIPLTTRMSGKGAAPECHVSPRVPSLSALSSQLPRSVPLSIETSVFDAARACHPEPYTRGRDTCWSGEAKKGGVGRSTSECHEGPGATVAQDPEPPPESVAHLREPRWKHELDLHRSPPKRGGKRVARDQSARRQDQLALTWAFSARREGFEPPTARSVGGCSPSIR